MYIFLKKSYTQWNIIINLTIQLENIQKLMKISGEYTIINEMHI